MKNSKTLFYPLLLVFSTELAFEEKEKGQGGANYAGINTGSETSPNDTWANTIAHCIEGGS